jgi:tRNA threonylcarbamoyl adenosine modification protein (Sua5/YciO/YrdC/YwlC family)
VVTVPARLEGSEPGALVVAAEALRQGSVVAIPTDTVYGLAVAPDRPGAVERLFALKGRPRDVPLPVLVGSWAQVGSVAGCLAFAAEHLAGRFWPGPLTLVVPRADGFTVDLGGPPSAHGTVGVRWPDHPVVTHLCRQLGPLAVTSANRHGSPPAHTAEQVTAALSEAREPLVVVDGGRCDGEPSTVVECVGRTTRCLRQGAVPWSEVVEAL